MADPSVTYSFVNGEVASAPNVNQNFTDILGAIRSASTADLGCGTLKIAGVAFASAAVSAIQSTSVAALTVVNTFTAGNMSTAGGFSAASGTVSGGVVLGNVVVGSAASEGAGTLVTEGGIHVYSGANVEGSVQAGSLYVGGNKVFDRGSFTATLAGVDTPTSTTGYYTIHGDVATVFLPAVGFYATSNTNYMYFSGLPAAITDNISVAQPAFLVACPNVGLHGGVAVNSQAVAALIGYDVGNLDRVYFTIDKNLAAWSAIGDKGINSRFAFDIPLTGLIL
jgi:hypothetical protein